MYSPSQHGGQLLSPLYAAHSDNSSEESIDRSRHVNANEGSSGNLLQGDHAVESKMTDTTADIRQRQVTTPTAEAAQTYPDTQLFQFADIELAHH